jgi:hypothetical protein
VAIPNNKATRKGIIMKKRLKKKMALREMESWIPGVFTDYERVSLARYRKLAKASNMPANMLVGGPYDSILEYYDLVWHPYLWIEVVINYEFHVCIDVEEISAEHPEDEDIDYAESEERTYERRIYTPNRAPWSSETSKHFRKRRAKWWSDYMSLHMTEMQNCINWVWYDTPYAINEFVEAVVFASR